MKKKTVIGCGISCGIASLLLVIGVICLLTWFHNMIDDSMSKKEIFEYVRSEQEILLEVIAEIESLEKEYGTSGYGPRVKSISHTDIYTYIEEVEGLYVYISGQGAGGIYKEIDNELFESVINKKTIQEISRHEEGVSFYCGGSGFGPATSYYGFYYSFDGSPKDYWCGTGFGSPEQLKPDGDGFSIKYPNDDNYYYTEKITDNFYYYEAHF